MNITVGVTIAAPPTRVWSEIDNVARHVEWMTDAESIEFVSARTQGVGTRFVCVTKVGPFRLRDTMTITVWQPDRAMGITHDGLVHGSGKFTLSADADRTRFVWEETLRFPWWMGGPIGAFAAKPALSGIWKRNLVRLKANCER